MIYLLLGTLAALAACEALTRLYRRHLRTRTEDEGVEWEDEPSDDDLWLDGDPEWSWPSQDKDAAATLQRPAA